MTTADCERLYVPRHPHSISREGFCAVRIQISQEVAYYRLRFLRDSPSDVRLSYINFTPFAGGERVELKGKKLSIAHFYERKGASRNLQRPKKYLKSEVFWRLYIKSGKSLVKLSRASYVGGLGDFGVARLVYRRLDRVYTLQWLFCFLVLTLKDVFVT